MWLTLWEILRTIWMIIGAIWFGVVIFGGLLILGMNGREWLKKGRFNNDNRWPQSVFVIGRSGCSWFDCRTCISRRLFGIGYQIEEWLDDRKNKKNGNLHITVDQSWKEKMK